MIHKLDIGLASSADENIPVFHLPEENVCRKLALRAFDGESVLAEIDAHGI